MAVAVKCVTLLTLMSLFCHSAGGYTKWRQSDLDSRSYLATLLQELGYDNYYVGKFLVEYSIYNYNPAPKGWKDFDALVQVCSCYSLLCHLVL